MHLCCWLHSLQHKVTTVVVVTKDHCRALNLSLYLSYATTMSHTQHGLALAKSEIALRLTSTAGM